MPQSLNHIYVASKEKPQKSTGADVGVIQRPFSRKDFVELSVYQMVRLKALYISLTQLMKTLTFSDTNRKNIDLHVLQRRIVRITVSLFS